MTHPATLTAASVQRPTFVYVKSADARFAGNDEPDRHDGPAVRPTRPGWLCGASAIYCGMRLDFDAMPDGPDTVVELFGAKDLKTGAAVDLCDEERAEVLAWLASEDANWEGC